MLCIYKGMLSKLSYDFVSIIYLFQRHILPSSQSSSLIGQFRAHSEGATCLDLSANGRHLWSGGLDKFVRQWDLRCSGNNSISIGNNTSIFNSNKSNTNDDNNVSSNENEEAKIMSGSFRKNLKKNVDKENERDKNDFGQKEFQISERKMPSRVYSLSCSPLQDLIAVG